jgi:hypothetical protein
LSRKTSRATPRFFASSMISAAVMGSPALDVRRFPAEPAIRGGSLDESAPRPRRS